MFFLIKSNFSLKTKTKGVKMFCSNCGKEVSEKALFVYIVVALLKNANSSESEEKRLWRHCYSACLQAVSEHTDFIPDTREVAPRC